jgi:N-acetylneuraminic acid mutarotase
MVRGVNLKGLFGKVKKRSVYVMKRTAITLTLISALLMLAVAGTLSVYAAEDSWASKAPMHEARSGLGVAVVNGKIYAIGGASSNGFRATTEEYDPATNTWSFKEPMPTPRSAFGIAVYQNKIYCIGGYISGDATGANEVYDPATDMWETKASMPTPTLNLQANVVNGKIYLIGGNSNGKLNQVYDPANDTWLTKASVPTAVSSYASAVVDNKIYVITSNLNQIYDAENDSWSLGPPAPLPAVLGSAGATAGVNAPERVYVFGADADLPFWQLTTRNFTAQSYDPKTDSWTACASMPTGRFSASVAVVDDFLYVIGGYTLEFPTARFTLNPSYKFKAVNEQYTPFGYGTVPPAVHVVSPENKTYASSNVSLTFTVNKQTSWIGFSLDGQETVTVTGNTTLAGLTSGVHNIAVYAKDTFENTGNSETIGFSIAEPFPTTWLIAATLIVAVVGAGLLVYLKKRNKKTKTQRDSL